MHYSIYITDRPDSAADRVPAVEPHRAYIKARAHKILAAGATFADDGKTVRGGNYIVDMTREEVDEFVANDPFTLAGIRESIVIQPWIKACFDRAFLIAVTPPGAPDVNEPLVAD
ncbi:YciI family protein [Sphingopyxis sp. MC1]|uniref:YciI family protein n=1 Tax=Sphingopyxis sp. MC1 TaxID=1174684 RepID=UPI0002D14B99|nr:YciI family protein [Sphingopyxis sp. MC1]ENY82835.1 hypothetical protein EBMC1_01995 [Sphingopyxis sp. MC1]MBN2973572.1 YciI family protein [Roseomonas aeriglobus]